MTLAFMPLLAVPSKAVSTEVDDIALGALESFDPGSVFRFTGPDVIRLVVVEGDVVDSGGVDNGEEDKDTGVPLKDDPDFSKVRRSILVALCFVTKNPFL